MRVVVCDAGPIIHLYEAHCLPLLSRTGDLFLPPRVYLEVQASTHMDTHGLHGFRSSGLPVMSEAKQDFGRQPEDFMLAKQRPFY